MYDKGKDIRNVRKFMDRLDMADKITNKIFIRKEQKGFEFKRYEGDHTIEKIMDFHKKMLEKYMGNLKNDLENTKLNNKVDEFTLNLPNSGKAPVTEIDFINRI